MSFKAYFMFAAGITQTLKVPVGTKDRINSHIEWVESELNIEREKYLDNPVHWKYSNYKDIPDKTLCEVAEKHNKWVRDLYESFAHWSKTPPDNFEEVTNEDFQQYLPALTIIDVSSERWTGEYYTARMEALYEAMRGREAEGMSFDSKALTTKQASAVILLFSQYLDNDDRRLEVPNGHDYLASSYDGGYYWCEKCGATTYDDAEVCNKRKCPYQIELKLEED